MTRWRSVVGAVTAAGVVAALAVAPAHANHESSVTAIRGSAYGFFTNISLLGSPFSTRGPSPSATVPTAGGNVSVTDPDGDSAIYGPATFVKTGAMTAASSGATGVFGSVVASSDVAGAPDGPGPFLYSAVHSDCSASGTGVTGVTSISGGVVETATDPSTGEPTSTQPVPASPPVGHTINGTINHVGDSFRAVFNEQVLNADGSLTVNAAHLYLLGPNAVGDVIIGQSVCGVTVSPAPHSADLSVTLADAPDPVGVRSALTYTVTIANAGPDSASAVHVELALAGTKFMSASGATCTVLKGKVKGVECDLAAPIAGGGSAAFTVVTETPAKAGTADATATVSSAAVDSNSGNDTATATTVVTK